MGTSSGETVSASASTVSTVCPCSRMLSMAKRRVASSIHHVVSSVCTIDVAPARLCRCCSAVHRSSSSFAAAAWCSSRS
jgi:hypothetical protein